MRVLDAQYTASGLTLPESVRSLTHPDCRAVTVGHQLVLAGGPAFFSSQDSHGDPRRPRLVSDIRSTCGARVLDGQ